MFFTALRQQEIIYKCADINQTVNRMTLSFTQEEAKWLKSLFKHPKPQLYSYSCSCECSSLPLCTALRHCNVHQQSLKKTLSFSVIFVFSLIVKRTQQSENLLKIIMWFRSGLPLWTAEWGAILKTSSPRIWAHDIRNWHLKTILSLPVGHPQV